MPATAQDLKALMAQYRQQTPSAPDWFRVIDHTVGVLLALEIERQEDAERFANMPGSGPVLAKVRALIQSRQEVTAKECREAIPEARAKQVFNALAYLTRRKMIHRDGYGKYRALVALYPRDPS
jgi:hypothetical protein